jgi:DinB superfamily
MFDADQLINRLEKFGPVLPAIVEGFSDADLRWKPTEKDWSVLEIVRHLLDEETGDFRRRMRLTIIVPDQPWPEIDPQGWAIARKYNEGSAEDAATRFAAERKASVAFLQGLDEGVWTTAYQHPKFGPIHAGDLLAAWAAHDALHLRQIARRMFQLAQRDGGEYSTIYAGEWYA